MPYVIGLDYGSLSCRGILADVRNGCILAESEASYLHGILTEHLPDGTALADSWCLQHPQDYLTVLDQILPQLLSKSMIDPDAIIGIGVDFTASTVIPLDAVRRFGEDIILIDANHLPGGRYRRPEEKDRKNSHKKWEK